jgi:virginiamycin A acetyltransferase
MTHYLKLLGQVCASVMILPLYLSYAVGSRLTSRDDSLQGHSHFLAIFPGRLGSYLRVAFYRLTLEHCDRNARIEFGVLFSKSGTTIGRNVYIGPYSQIGLATIEDEALIGPSVLLISGSAAHGYERLDIPIREQPGILKRIRIGKDSWIGAGAIVMADVEDQSIVGAGSVVTKCYTPRMILAGNPARPIRARVNSTDESKLNPLPE